MSDLHIRIDEAVATGARKELAEMGLTIDEAVHILLSRVVKDKRLPFTPNAETLAAMQELDRGEGKRFSTVEALMADLHEDD